MMDIFLVVANQFDQFSRQENVISHGLLQECLRKRKENFNLRGKKFVAGQGLCVLDVQNTYQMGLQQGFEDEFVHWHFWAKNPPASKQLSHKQKIENILISAPRKESDGSFFANFLLHARNELMLDHLTGQHVQGMVLAEACRQMFLAVTERFCLDGYEPERRYFIVNEMNLRYLAFAFPLPAEIRYRVLEQKQPRADRVYIHAKMEVWQGGQIASEVEVKFAVMDAAILEKREAILASKAIAIQMKNLHSIFNMEQQKNDLILSGISQSFH